MSTYKLSASDVTTLNLAADLAAAQAKAAARECKKAFLDNAEREAQQLEGYADEAKNFLANIERGTATLSSGHVTALGTGMRILYLGVRKTRERELTQLIPTEGSETRSAEIRETFRKLRLNVQLEIEDEQEAVAAERRSSVDEAA